MSGRNILCGEKGGADMSDNDIKNLGSFVWSIAELLRGDFRQSEYGKVVLPFVVLRRLDCILEESKPAVLEMAATLPEDMDDADRSSLIQALQRKAVTDLSALAQGLGLSPVQVAGLQALCTWHGPLHELAAKNHPWVGPAAQSAQDLLDLAQMLAARFPSVNLHLDSGELSGFHYETGVTWAAYAAGRGRALARGGRYDGVGETFGLARPATGFSADLNALLEEAESMDSPALVWAPATGNADLEAEISRQRDSGVCVRRALPGEDIPAAAAQLVFENSTWVIK
jgi:ATP phosphoribosyltransferase regulatory subunit